jgi:hypothetical protein
MGGETAEVEEVEATYPPKAPPARRYLGSLLLGFVGVELGKALALIALEHIGIMGADVKRSLQSLTISIRPTAWA